MLLTFLLLPLLPSLASPTMDTMGCRGTREACTTYCQDKVNYMALSFSQIQHPNFQVESDPSCLSSCLSSRGCGSAEVQEAEVQVGAW